MNQAIAEAGPEVTFPTWRTIKIGTGLKTANDFNKAIESAGMNRQRTSSTISRSQEVLLKLNW
jgi:hypothetical protein